MVRTLKNRFVRILRNRLLIILILLIQIVIVAYTIWGGSYISHLLGIISPVLSVVLAILIFNRQDLPEYRLIWIFIVLVFPVFGGLLYLLLFFQPGKRALNQKIVQINRHCRQMFFENPEDAAALADAYDDYAGLSRYLHKYNGFPVYAHTQTTYFSPGERYFESLLAELEAAEYYIFIESFIVAPGEMWDRILDILIRKAAAGVEIRLLYDGMGTLLHLPEDYPRELRKYGIDCRVFSPFSPFLSTLQNNRDHRKIVSIDGKVAFCGGINIADEYINHRQKRGHWKDSAVMLRGDAAWSLTLFFLELWEPETGNSQDFLDHYPWTEDKPCEEEFDGYVQPFYDSPIDDERICQQVYLDMIHSARRYLWIMTPYLIIDSSVIAALEHAAKRGVDIRIMTPFRRDRWFVHMTTRSYYRQLISAGVKIFEYLPGFIHSKTILVDGRCAIVGSINLDYRSMFLHFECGVWMCGSRAVAQLQDDFQAVFPRCREIHLEDTSTNLFVRFVRIILQLFSPLM